MGTKHSISRRRTFSPNLHLAEKATFFPFFAPCCGLNWIIQPCASAVRTQIYWILNRFLLNRIVYSVPAAMFSVINRESFLLAVKDVSSDLLITGRSFKNLSYLWSFLYSQKWKLRKIYLNLLRGIESYLAWPQKCWGSSSNKFKVWGIFRTLSIIYY